MSENFDNGNFEQLVMDTNPDVRGLGHIFAPKGPDEGKLGTNLNLWNVFATKSWPLDLRVQIAKSTDSAVNEELQISLLTSDTTTLTDCALIGARAALMSEVTKHELSEGGIDAILICCDLQKKLVGDNGNFIFDTSKSQALAPIAMLDQIGGNLEITSKANSMSRMRWHFYNKEFFPESARSDKPLLDESISVHNWLQNDNNATPRDLQNTNLKAPVQLVIKVKYYF